MSAGLPRHKARFVRFEISEQEEFEVASRHDSKNL
jgi:hypothetical protein